MPTTFPIPQGFQPPDGVQPGQPFDAVASLKMADDGANLELVAVDGIPVGEDPEEAGEAKGPAAAAPPQAGGGFLSAMR